ncbi:MAG: hypothetical protein Q7S45_02660 [Candidatus Curtissbacteria bacterium]|nr:hypothetical protein [Candidatus Curtissbacteria bacterium]
MPTPPSLAEAKPVIAEAVIRKTENAQGQESAEVKQAKALRERMANEDPHTILQSLEQTRPVNKADSQKIIDKNISGELNEDGSVQRSTEQQRKFDEAKKFNDLAEALIEKGVDGLTTDQRRVAVQSVRGLVEAVPELKSRWESLNDQEINSEVSLLMKDPDFLSQVRDSHAEATSKDRLINVNAGDAREKSKNAKTKRESAEAEVARASGERESVDIQIEQFEDRNGKVGAKLTELRNLEAEAPALQASLDETQVMYEEARTDVKNLENLQLGMLIKGKDATQITEQLAQKRQEADRYRRELASTRSKLAKKEVLEREKAHLYERKGQIEAKRIDLQGGLDDAIRDFSLAASELEITLVGRKQAEEQFVDGLQNIITDATYNYLSGKINLAEQTWSKMLEEGIANSQDKIQKALLAGIKKKYERGPARKVHGIFRGGDNAAGVPEGLFAGYFGGEKLVPGKYDSEGIHKDFVGLAQSEKMGPLVKSALNKATDPATGERILTDEEIEGVVANPESVAQLGPKVVGELIRAKTNTEGITEDEAEIIAGSEWGANAILAEAEKKPDIKAEINERKEEMGAKDTKELLSKLGGKGILLLLLMLFGSIASQSIKSITTENR